MHCTWNRKNWTNATKVTFYHRKLCAVLAKTNCRQHWERSNRDFCQMLFDSHWMFLQNNWSVVNFNRIVGKHLINWGSTTRCSHIPSIWRNVTQSYCDNAWRRRRKVLRSATSCFVLEPSWFQIGSSWARTLRSNDFPRLFSTVKSSVSSYRNTHTLKLYAHVMRPVRFLVACVWFRDVTSFSDASGMVCVRIEPVFILTHQTHCSGSLPLERMRSKNAQDACRVHTALSNKKEPTNQS